MTVEEVTMSTRVEHPHILPGPWTREARERAISEEVRLAYIDYFRKAVKTRNWLPWDDLPLAEMRERALLLREDTFTLIKTFLGIEDYGGNSVPDATNIPEKTGPRRNI